VSPRNRASARDGAARLEDAIAGMVIAKRRGIGYTNPGDQLVLMTVRDLVALLTGSRPDEDEAAEGGAA
jgi:hypothetical protein